MLKDYDAHATLASSDVEQAKQWFRDKLGWQPSRELEGYARYDFGPSAFAVYASPSAGTAKNTVLYWLVDDAAATVASLRDRGLTFEEYEYGDFKTVNGVMTDPDGNHTAWFKDVDGNIISIIDTSDPAAEGQSNQVGAMIASSDLERSKAWYAKVGGYEPLFEAGGEVVGYRSGKTTFNVYRTQFAGTARNTVMGYGVLDIRAEMADLRSRGVTFEDYDMGDAKTENGLLVDTDGTTNAWFKDPDGNVLGLQGPEGMPPGWDVGG
jgi:catechol 2,3-dioxygenase-like lactoylglutathione lyase family enzyme